MFALDEFDNGITFHAILGVLIHLIPSYFLIAALIIAWKWETIGGILYLLLPIGFLWLIKFNFKFLIFDLLVIGILLLISVSFLIQPRLRKRIDTIS